MVSSGPFVNLDRCWSVLLVNSSKERTLCFLDNTALILVSDWIYKRTLNKKKTLSKLTHILSQLSPSCSYTLTPAEDDDGQKQRHVAVVQLQRVELDGELKLWFHHLTERFPETLEELSRHEDLSVGDQGPVFVHQR